MNLRENVSIPDCPIKWKTNLTNEELIFIYQKILLEPDYQVFCQNDNALFPYLVFVDVIKDNTDGTLYIVISKNKGIVLFKSNLTIAHEREIEELRQEIEDEKKTKALILVVDDKHLKNEIEKNIRERNFNTAKIHIEQRHLIRRENEDLKPFHISLFEWNICRSCIYYLSHFPDISYGIMHLEIYCNNSRQYIQMAESYLYNNLQKNKIFKSLRPPIPNQSIYEFKALFESGLKTVKDPIKLYKDFALFYERCTEYDFAVDLCKTIIHKNIPETNKKWFVAKVKRLLHKLNRSNYLIIFL